MPAAGLPRCLRVLVVDDDPNFVRAVVSMLDGDARVEVVGTAANGAEAVVLVHDLIPDIVLMDINMPVMGGLEATRDIAAFRPKTKVVLLTGEADLSGDDVTHAGAAVLLRKDQPLNDLLSVFCDVANLAVALEPEARARRTPV